MTYCELGIILVTILYNKVCFDKASQEYECWSISYCDNYLQTHGILTSDPKPKLHWHVCTTLMKMRRRCKQGERGFGGVFTDRIWVTIDFWCSLVSLLRFLTKKQKLNTNHVLKCLVTEILGRKKLDFLSAILLRKDTVSDKQLHSQLMSLLSCNMSQGWLPFTCETKGFLIASHEHNTQFYWQLEGSAYCALWGKCRRWVIVTKGWLRVFIGVILLSASSVSIFFSKSINSRRSAFSAKMSVPSRLVILTCRRTRIWYTTHQNRLPLYFQHRSAPRYSIVLLCIFRFLRIWLHNMDRTL